MTAGSGGHCSGQFIIVAIDDGDLCLQQRCAIWANMRSLFSAHPVSAGNARTCFAIIFPVAEAASALWIPLVLWRLAGSGLSGSSSGGLPRTCC